MLPLSDVTHQCQVLNFKLGMCSDVVIFDHQNVLCTSRNFCWKCYFCMCQAVLVTEILRNWFAALKSASNSTINSLPCRRFDFLMYSNKLIKILEVTLCLTAAKF